MDNSRRKFLKKLSLGLGSLVATAATVPFLGSLFSPWFRDKKEEWITVGPVEDFPKGSVTMVTYENPDPEDWAGKTRDSAMWLRHDEDDGFIGFFVNCTHLGCPIRWEQKAHLFFCPCHGGVFYKNGEVAAGPPSTALKRYEMRIRNGMVEFLTSKVPIINIKYTVEQL